MKLYGYWRSSCTWRVRIAPQYKGLDFEYIPVHLVNNGGEQFSAAHTERNPLAQVPVLEINSEDGTQLLLSQSLAIMEYLEERFPASPILPTKKADRAYVRQVSEIINAGIQPVQNLATLKAIVQLGADKMQWGRRWIQDGLLALEQLLSARPSQPYLCLDTPTMADFCLIPQLYNARRFGCDMELFPTLLAVEARCALLKAFQLAHPDQQIDAQ